MAWSYSDMTRAREAVEAALTRLGLAEYLFTVVPTGAECDVRIEYAATEGWKMATLRVAEGELLASAADHVVQARLVREWRNELTHARYLAGVDEALRAEAVALGQAWADEKADALRDRVPAEQWSDFWDDAEDQPLPSELHGVREHANRAARQRWIELVSEQRSVESAEPETERAEVVPQGTGTGS
jgi:hypothetical protein